MSAQAVAFALHALEPDEDITVQNHLPQCRSCQETARETELVLGGFGASVEQVDPPPRLRENVLARIKETPQLPPLPGATQRSASSESDDAPRRRAEPDRGAGGGRWARQLSLRGRRRLVAAAVAVIGVLGVGGLGVYAAQVQQQRDAQIAQSQILAEIVTQLDRPGTTHATLTTPRGEPVAAVLTTGTQRTVVTAGLTPNDRDDTIYVVWGTSTRDPRPIGTFDVDAASAGVHSVNSAGEAEAFSGYAISVEPGRAAPAAPTTVVASGQVD